MIDTIIIGGGASGMMAAICVGRQFSGTSKKALLIDQKERLGKKVLATGNGKCNYTNTDMNPSFFFGEREMIDRTFEKFNHPDTIAFFRQLGVYPRVRNGCCYPLSEQASSVVWALETEIRRLPVEIHTRTKVVTLQKIRDGFSVRTDKGTFCSRTVVVACGGKASPKLGSDGSLFPEIGNLGHHMNPFRPVLCGFTCKGMDFKEAAGVRCEGKVSLISGKRVCASDAGELQFTEYGLSGIPVFQISHRTGELLALRKTCTLELSFLPELTGEACREELRFRRKRNGRFSSESLLMGLLPQKLIPAVLSQAGISMTDRVSSLTEEQLVHLEDVLRHFVLIPVAPRDFEFAQVSAGGIRAEEVDPRTLGSRLVPGLFFAGEVLDVDALCGGYNLQWAWSSGFAAGEAVCKYLEQYRS